MLQDHTEKGSWRTGLCRGLWCPLLRPLRGFMVVAVEACDLLSVLRHGLLGGARSHSRPPLCLLSLALGADRHTLRSRARCAHCALQPLLCPLCCLLSPDLQCLRCPRCLLSQRGFLQQCTRLERPQPYPVCCPLPADPFLLCSLSCIFSGLSFPHSFLCDKPRSPY